MSKQLRITEFLIQPIAVWDDGANLTPAVQPDGTTHVLSVIRVPSTELADFVAKWPEQLAAVQAQLDADETPKPNRATRRASAKSNGNGKAKTPA